MCLAIPGRVIEVAQDSLRSGKVEFGAVTKDASLALVPEAVVGDYVIVHAGMALQVIDEESARHIFDALKELDEALESESVEPS